MAQAIKMVHVHRCLRSRASTLPSFAEVLLSLLPKAMTFLFSPKSFQSSRIRSQICLLSVLFREAQPEFMEKVINLCKLRLQHMRAMDFHGTFTQELKNIFSEEIRSHACPRHLDYLMQEIFAQTFVSLKVLAPFLFDLLFATKRVSVIKRVLLFKPSFSSSTVPFLTFRTAGFIVGLRVCGRGEFD